MANNQRHSLRAFLAAYCDKRIAIIFLFGIASGFPWLLIGKAMTVWLQESGLTRTGIGYFGSIFVVYTLNFLWAPVVDRVRLPLLRVLGQRRSWIMLCHLVILCAMLAIAFTDPAVSLFWTSSLALLIAIASATQDIAIDAYRIDSIASAEEAKISAAAAAATSGWWTGFGAFGGIALIAADYMSWSSVYLLLTSVVIAGLVVVLAVREPATDRAATQQQDAQFYAQWFGGRSFSGAVLPWLMVTFVQPIREFFMRNGAQLALAILGFIFLFKIGEAFLGRMSIVFYKEIGFSNSEIGIYSSLIGWGVTILFTVIGSAISIRYGLLRGLMVGGIAMAATNVMFSAMALVGPDTRLFAATVVIDTFTSACATVAFVAFISYLTSRAYSATQYALMASLGNLGRTLLAIYSGAMVDFLDGDWALFFLLTAVMVLPGLSLLHVAGRRLKGAVADRHSPL